MVILKKSNHLLKLLNPWLYRPRYISLMHPLCIPRKLKVVNKNEDSTQYKDEHINSINNEPLFSSSIDQTCSKFLNQLPGGNQGDIVYSTSFGHLRFDSDNIATVKSSADDNADEMDINLHNNDENTSMKINTDINSSTTPYIDEQFLRYIKNNINDSNTVESVKDLENDKMPNYEEIFFQKLNKDLQGFELDELSNFDMSMFNLHDSTIVQVLTENKPVSEVLNNTETKTEVPTQTLQPSMKKLAKTNFSENLENEKTDNNLDDEFVDFEKKDRKISSINVQDRNSFKYILNKRREEKELSGIQNVSYQRILKDMIHLDHMTRQELILFLKKSIIYNEGEIFAINKPYGLAVQPGMESRRYKGPTLTELLPDLAKELNIPELYPIHRLDLTTSGCLLFAKTSSMASKLKLKFKNREIIKKYYAITKGVPDMEQGLIDIPIDDGNMDGIHRKILRPNLKGFKDSRTARHGITKFKVLSALNSAALIEVQPVTGITHQIRVHLGLGLSCPIIGDHKYSSSKKIVPQKLSSDLLEKLQLKQSRVRDLPIFLHSHTLVLPELLDGKNVYIKAQMPVFFKRAVKLLGLSKFKNVTMARYGEAVKLDN